MAVRRIIILLPCAAPSLGMTEREMRLLKMKMLQPFPECTALRRAFLPHFNEPVARLDAAGDLGAAPSKPANLGRRRGFESGSLR
jgi:hypothetical protein